MPIVVDYSPSAETVLGVAQQAGYGDYLRQQQEFAARQQALAQEANQRQQELAFRVADSNRRFSYGAAMEQAQREDRRNELQQAQASRLQEMQMTQEFEKQQAEAKQQAEMQAFKDRTEFTYDAETKAKLNAFERTAEQIRNSPDYSDDEKQQAIQALHAKQFGYEGPKKIPVYEESLKELNARTIPASQPGGARMIRNSKGDFEIHPEDKYKLDMQKEANDIKIKEMSARQQLIHDANTGWQKMQMEYDSYVTKRDKDRDTAINDATRAATKRYADNETTNAKLLPGQTKINNPVPDIDAIERSAAEKFDKSNPLRPAPDREDYYNRMLPPQSVPPQTPPAPAPPAQPMPPVKQAPPQQQSAPEMPQPMNAPPLVMPVTPKVNPAMQPLFNSLIQDLGGNVDQGRVADDMHSSGIRGLRTGSREGEREFAKALQTKAARIRKIMAEYPDPRKMPVSIASEYTQLRKELSAYRAS